MTEKVKLLTFYCSRCNRAMGKYPEGGQEPKEAICYKCAGGKRERKREAGVCELEGCGKPLLVSRGRIRCHITMGKKFCSMEHAQAYVERASPELKERVRKV